MQSTKQIIESVVDDFTIKFDAAAEARRIGSLAQREGELRQIKVAELRRTWGAPTRHVEAVACFGGDWGATYQAILSKLHSGLLAALVGGRGTGKTQMAVELMRVVTGKLMSARFITATDFFIQIKGTYRKDAEEKEADVLKRFQRPPLLVIDEIGKRGETDWESNLLFELINRRYNDKTDTVLIDNRSAQDFTAAIGPSLASRMVECGGIIECNWKSFR